MVTSREIFAFWAGVAAENIYNWLMGLRGTMVRPRNVLLAVLVASAFAASFVDAQTSTPALSPVDVVPRVTEAIDGALSKLASGALSGMGATISAFFLVAMMVWTAVKTMASGKGVGELLGEWVPIWVSFAFVYAFLNHAGGAAITATMDSIAKAIGGGSMSTLSSALAVVTTPVFEAILQVAKMPMLTEIGWDLSTWAPFLAAGLTTIITKIVTVIFLLTAAVAGMASVIMSFISLQLVLFLAPVMVPFVMFKPTTWIFDSWLKFLLGAAMMKIVLAFMLTAVSGVLGAMSTLAGQMALDSKNLSSTDQLMVDLLIHAMMMIFALLSTLLLLQVPSIATGLISGGAGSTGFSGIKGLTQSPSGKITNAPLQGTTYGAAKGGATAAKDGLNYGVGRWSGHKQGSSLQQSDVGTRTGARKAGFEAGYRSARGKVHGPVIPGKK